MKAIILLHFFIFFSFPGFAQGPDPTINEGRKNIAGVSREGFSTSFSTTPKNIDKCWWKYCKEFGRPLNMKSYYQVTIPSTENSGNVDLVLLSKTSGTGSNCIFFLTLKNGSIPKDLKERYMQQVKLILKDFKKFYYVGQLEAAIHEMEKELKKISKDVEKGKREMEELIKAEQKLDALHEVLRKVYLRLE